jgi:hypothetical protein
MLAMDLAVKAVGVMFLHLDNGGAITGKLTPEVVVLVVRTTLQSQLVQDSTAATVVPELLLLDIKFKGIE